jgi:tRNA pseudouridine38-40 synthase
MHGGAMRNLKLVLEYDGTEFHGFQRQSRLRTVQGVLEERFSRVLGEPVAVIGAGRTDAGVHASGQVVSFRTTRPVPLARMAEVLNAALPADVKVQSCEQVAPEFHARRSAVSRTYRYTVIERERPSPLLGRFALVLPGRLAEGLMAAAAGRFVGRRDFRAFQASGSETKTTERTLFRLDCARQHGRITVTAKADSFLYQMVRNIVSALLAVGRGQLTAEQVAEAMAEGDRRRLPPPAASCGLCLTQVSYRISDLGSQISECG